MSSRREITITFPGGKRVDAELDGRVVRTDQSPDSGGDGSAPEPFVLFLSSLGTCAGIYVLSFLQSRQLPTEGLELKQRLEVDPESHKLLGVELEIRVPESIPAKYHPALIRAAEKCAVKRVLDDPPQFDVHVQQIADRPLQAARRGAP